MSLNKEEKEMLQEARDTARELKIVIVGMDGDEGLVGEVRKYQDKCETKFEEQGKSIGKLKRTLYTLIGILLGAGVISGGTAGIINAINNSP